MVLRNCLDSYESIRRNDTRIGRYLFIPRQTDSAKLFLNAFLGITNCVTELFLQLLL